MVEIIVSVMDTVQANPSEQRDLWLTRYYYLIWFAGLGFVSPFLNLFLVHLGLNGTEIGIIIAITYLITLIAAPFWANRNDVWRNPRAILQALLAFTGLSWLLLSQQTAFVPIIVVSALQAVVMAGIPALSDTLALKVTTAAKAGYGSVRVYGSLGWVIFVPLSGWIVERTELKSSLLGTAFFSLVAAVFLFRIDPRYFSSATEKVSASMRGIVHKLLDNPLMVGAGLMILLIGIFGSGAYQFQGVYLGELGAPGTVIGIAGMLGAVVELPVMLWTDRLTTTWGSYRLLLVSMLMWVGIRAMIFLFASIPLIMLAEAIGGIAYSFYAVALVRFIAEQTDEHETRTVLALYTVTFTSLIGILSGPLAGLAFDHLGARALYLIAAVGYALAWISLYAARHVKQSARQSA